MNKLKSNLSNKFAVIFMMVMAAGLIALSSCSSGTTNTTINTTTTDQYVEITEYEGEDLSSINDFIENSIKGPQYVDQENYLLAIDGLVDTPLSLTYDQVINNHQSYRKLVTLTCVEGWSVDILWDGISVKELLDEAGIKTEANTVIFYSYDGYSTSLPLDFVIDRNIILADQMNGVTIPPERGFPFQVVAESKWGYKWAKWVTRIELSAEDDYKGYWESRGYSNDADVGGKIFGP